MCVFYVFQLVLNRLWMRKHQLQKDFGIPKTILKFELKKTLKIVYQATPVTCGNAHICKKMKCFNKFIPIDRVFLGGGQTGPSGGVGPKYSLDPPVVTREGHPRFDTSCPVPP